MAKILGSGIGIVELYGSTGNTTISRNQYGPYAKVKDVTPINPTWTAVSQVALAAITALWTNTLTDAQRLKWIEASGYAKRKLSKRVMLKGFQLFTRVNMNLGYAGGTLLLEPVQAEPLLIFSSLSLTYSPGTSINIIWTPAPSSGYEVLIYASPYVSGGRMTPSQAYAFLARQTAATGTTNVRPPYVAKYGFPTAGQKTWFKVDAINLNTGQRSPSQFLSLQY